MTTIIFRKIVCGFIKQFQFRLVPEFNWCCRRSLCYVVQKGNFVNQISVRFPLAITWYQGKLVCTCQSNNIIMSQCKHDSNNSNTVRKMCEEKINVHTDKLKSDSLKKVKKRKKRKHSHHCHKKRSKDRSSKTSAKLISLDSSSDSDIHIIYDSRTKGRILNPFHCTLQTKNHKKEKQKKNLSINATSEWIVGDKCINTKVKLSDDVLVEETNVNSILHQVPERCPSVVNTCESYSRAKRNQNTDRVCESFSSADDFTQGVELFQADSGPSEFNVQKKKSENIQRDWDIFGYKMSNENKDSSCNESNYLMFTVLSYNVLCQDIMEEHKALYKFNDASALDWNYRSKLLMNEFMDFNADIMCLQEVQRSHLESFYSELEKLGYTALFKQRTGNKKDGVAIYFRNSTFQLIDSTTVEFYQPGVNVLNRDNVGLVVKLAPIKKPDERIVVATTHLLYNPRRHDVKLAQIQILLAEVERFAFREFDERMKTTRYWPVILSGDMNFKPNTGGFQLLNSGRLQFQSLCSRTLTPGNYGYGPILGKELIPSYLDVTDNCQHRSLLQERSYPSIRKSVFKSEDHKKEEPLLKIYNSDFTKLQVSPSKNLECLGKKESLLGNGPNEFGSGQLTHSLQLKSVYVYDSEYTEYSNDSQVSTFQNEWVVVDHIFYSHGWKPTTTTQGKLMLVARCKLPSKKAAENAGPIPNLSSPSDHYPLAAKFALLL